MQEITIVGGGLAGLTAAISCAEQGAPVRLLEAHDELGGRARSTDGPYKVNLGPHALLAIQPAVVVARRARPDPAVRASAAVRRSLSLADDIRRVPAVGAAVAALRLRGRAAPVELDFRSWAAELVGDEAADALSRSAGILTYHHDPGSAVGRVRVGAGRPRAALGAPDRTLPDRRLVADHRSGCATGRSRSACGSRREPGHSSCPTRR